MYLRKNPLGFNFSLINYLINSNLILAAPILLIPFLSILLLSINRLTISYNCPTITSCELVSFILVLLPKPKVVTAVNSVVTSTLGTVKSL